MTRLLGVRPFTPKVGDRVRVSGRGEGYVDRIANSKPRVYYVVPWDGKGTRPLPFQEEAILAQARELSPPLAAPTPIRRVLKR